MNRYAESICLYEAAYFEVVQELSKFHIPVPARRSATPVEVEGKLSKWRMEELWSDRVLKDRRYRKSLSWEVAMMMVKLRLMRKSIKAARISEETYWFKSPQVQHSSSRFVVIGLTQTSRMGGKYALCSRISGRSVVSKYLSWIALLYPQVSTCCHQLPGPTPSITRHYTVILQTLDVRRAHQPSMYQSSKCLALLLLMLWLIQLSYMQLLQDYFRRILAVSGWRVKGYFAQMKHIH